MRSFSLIRRSLVPHRRTFVTRVRERLRQAVNEEKTQNAVGSHLHKDDLVEFKMFELLQDSYYGSVVFKVGAVKISKEFRGTCATEVLDQMGDFVNRHTRGAVM